MLFEQNSLRQFASTQNESEKGFLFRVETILIPNSNPKRLVGREKTVSQSRQDGWKLLQLERPYDNIGSKEKCRLKTNP